MQLDVHQAIKALKNDELIAYQSDTLPGIGCNPYSQKAIDALFELKKRDPSKSLILLVHNDGQLQRLFKEIPDLAWDLIDATTTPLTLVLNNALTLPKGVAAADGTLAVRRVTEGPCLELLKRWGKPLVSTSANISGEESPSKLERINPSILEKLAGVYPAENNKFTGKASSIIKLGNGGAIDIIRK